MTVLRGMVVITLALALLSARRFKLPDAVVTLASRGSLEGVSVSPSRGAAFSTNTSSNKVKCFKANNKASVYFIDKRFFRGASLVGTMEVLETPDAKEKLWQDGDEMFYKLGVTDPDYCVLKFSATKCRFYGNFKSEDIVLK